MDDNNTDNEWNTHFCIFSQSTFTLGSLLKGHNRTILAFRKMAKTPVSVLSKKAKKRQCSLSPKGMLRHWNYLLSSVAKDGKDENDPYFVGKFWDWKTSPKTEHGLLFQLKYTWCLRSLVFCLNLFTNRGIEQ